MSAGAGVEATNRRRVALVGVGVIGTHHGRVISELADRLELVAVVDTHLERAQRLADARADQFIIP